MKRFLIPGLVIVHLLLHALAVWAAMEQWYQSSPEGRLGVFLPLAVSTLGPSQGALLAVWIALGRRGIPWRVALAAIGTVVYLGCFHNADSEWLSMTIGEMGIMVALLLCARLTGLELTHVAQQSTVRPRFQFFIRDILAWTTALAVVMSAEQFLALHKWCPGFPSPVGESFAVFGTLSLVVMASLWASLGRTWSIVRIALPPAAVAAGAAILVANSWFRVTMALSQVAAWTVASLLVVRWAGYRLSWHWRFSRRAGE